MRRSATKRVVCKFLLHLVSAFLLLSSATAWAQPAKALVLVFYDQTLQPAVLEHELGQIKALMQSEVEFVVLQGKDGDSFKSNYTSLAAERQNLLRTAEVSLSQDTIQNFSSLLILTHGMTKTLEDGSTATNLRGIGDILENGLDTKATEFFSPFRGRFTDDANVFLVSCSTLCGTRSQVAARSQSLMNYLGITDGKLYGSSVTDVVSIPPSDPLAEKLRVQNIRYVTRANLEYQRFFALASTVPQLVAFAGAMIADQMTGTNFSDLATKAFLASPIEYIGIYGLSLATALSIHNTPRIAKEISKQLESVVGFVVQMGRGQVIDMAETSKIEARRKVFGTGVGPRSCSGLFSGRD